DARPAPARRCGRLDGAPAHRVGRAVGQARGRPACRRRHRKSQDPEKAMTQQRSALVPPSTIRFERLLPGPVERVWAYLTESKKRATWLAGGEFDLRVGGKIELLFDNDSLSDEKKTGGTRRFEGRITRLEPNRALAYTWNWDGRDSDVLYELTPKG